MFSEEELLFGMSYGTYGILSYIIVISVFYFLIPNSNIMISPFTDPYTRYTIINDKSFTVVREHIICFAPMLHHVSSTSYAFHICFERVYILHQKSGVINEQASQIMEDIYIHHLLCSWKTKPSIFGKFYL